MSYENAPATRLVATHCVACGRPLVDAISVEAGMGPDCRTRYSVHENLTPEARAEVNARVHRLAVGNLGAADIAAELVMIRAFGCETMADKLESRLVDVRLSLTGSLLAVETPFNQDFTEDLRGVWGRRWDSEHKRWLVPADAESKKALWKVLRRHFAGGIGRGPNGLFPIDAPGGAS